MLDKLMVEQLRAGTLFLLLKGWYKDNNINF